MLAGFVAELKLLFDAAKGLDPDLAGTPRRAASSELLVQTIPSRVGEAPDEPWAEGVPLASSLEKNTGLRSPEVNDDFLLLCGRSVCSMNGAVPAAIFDSPSSGAWC